MVKLNKASQRGTKNHRFALVFMPPPPLAALKLMNIPKKQQLLKGDELKARAEELGVSLSQLYDTKGHINEPELQRRVVEAERSIRESKLWVVAVVAAAAAVISALGAWAAVLCA